VPLSRKHTHTSVQSIVEVGITPTNAPTNALLLLLDHLAAWQHGRHHANQRTAVIITSTHAMIDWLPSFQALVLQESLRHFAP